MKQVNISFQFNNRYINLHNFSLRVLSNVKERFGIMEIIKTSPVMGKPVAIARQLFQMRKRYKMMKPGKTFNFYYMYKFMT
jgi:FKBP-type peptidyl-prolyl cis-trans isomerase (trigger factor)